MAHRTLIDEAGVRWEVWDVRPHWTNRRSEQERRQRTIDDPDVDPPVLEERHGVDRRHVERKVVPRLTMPEGLSQGWLTFESAAERRRLSPIPSGWDTASTSELAAFCARASMVPARRVRLWAW